jgi:hypothetical protein
MATENSAFERMNPGTGSNPVYSPLELDVINGWRRISYPASFEPLETIDPTDPWFIYNVQANTPG